VLLQDGQRTFLASCSVMVMVSEKDLPHFKQL